MQIKGENADNKNAASSAINGLDNLTYSNLNSVRGGQDKLNDTGLSSTFKSIDLPPKEYEQQLQQYEAEVRNHIKVEQQLKLHIEVLNERIEEFEKEKEEMLSNAKNEFKDTEKKLKEKF